MSELVSLSPANVVEACTAGASEAAAALVRTFDTTVEVSVGAPGTLDFDIPPDACAGPGLAVVLALGSQAAVFVLGESSGLLPDWYRAPDATGVSKLTTLAQELGMLLLPESCMPDDFQAFHVPDLSAALRAAGTAAGAATLALELKHHERTSTSMLVWPVPEPAKLKVAPAEPSISSPASAESQGASTNSNKPGAPPVAAPTATHSEASPAVLRTPARAASPEPIHDFSQLPPFSQSLLRIRVPVTVRLASTKLPAQRVVELVPGTIIQFSKSCEEMLDLCVAGRDVGVGEAVKVGDKFGLRVTSMTMPGERFRPIGKTG